MPNYKDIIRNIKNIFIKPAEDEIKEIINIKPTDEDFEQGRKLAVIVVAVLAANGIPMSTKSTELIGQALAYLVRDIKDGVDDHNKLLIQRVINEIRNIRKKAED